jgi:hypothetical protein
MNWVIEIVGGGGVVPAAIAVAVFLGVRLLLSPEVGQRYSAAIAFAAAYSVGYVLLPSWAKVAPERHWQWTLYLALIAGSVGPIAAAGGLAVIERWILFFLVALVSASLLVPSWPDLEPPRAVWLCVLTTYIFVLAALLELLARRIPATILIGSLALASVCTAALTAAYVSVTHGRLAGIATASLAGSWVACFASWQKSAAGLALAYSVIVGGLAFIGCVEPRQPYVGLLVAPLAPLALWCSIPPAVQRLHAPTRTVVQIALVAAVLGGATAAVFIAGSGAAAD